jgi:hypothetical protein
MVETSIASALAGATANKDSVAPASAHFTTRNTDKLLGWKEFLGLPSVACTNSCRSFPPIVQRFSGSDPSIVEQAAKQILAIAVARVRTWVPFREDQNHDEKNVDDFRGNLCGSRPSSNRQSC